jgi:hypothetical protein
MEEGGSGRPVEWMVMCSIVGGGTDLARTSLVFLVRGVKFDP